MQKVISVNLGGRAYQVDEDGYAALVAYLDTAAQRLAGNPDRAEILRDLEQAIADKCDAYLNAHKTVVSAGEIAQIVQAMGPVEGEAAAPAADAPAGGSAGTGGTDGAARATGETQRRRLFRIREGSHIAGVCNGLGAYFDLDPNHVRVAFVLLAGFTGGAGILVYVALMFLMPEARTPEEFAAATGMPASAQDIVDRARRAVEDLGTRKWWTDRRREHRRWQRRAAWAGVAAPASPAAFVLGLVGAGLAIVLIVQVVSIVADRMVFGWALPTGVPTWAALLVLLALYSVVVTPLHRARYYQAYPPHSLDGPGEGLVRIAVGFAVLWFLVTHAADVGEFFRQLPLVVREFVRDARSMFAG